MGLIHGFFYYTGIVVLTFIAVNFVYSELSSSFSSSSTDRKK